MTDEEKAQKILLENISTSESILIEESETLPERILVAMVKFAEAYHQHKLKEVELPVNWKGELLHDYGLSITTSLDLKGCDNEGKFYYRKEEMQFLMAAFKELLKYKEEANT